MHSTADLWSIQCHVNHMALDALNQNNLLELLFVGHIHSSGQDRRFHTPRGTRAHAPMAHTFLCLPPSLTKFDRSFVRWPVLMSSESRLSGTA